MVTQFMEQLVATRVLTQEQLAAYQQEADASFVPLISVLVRQKGLDATRVLQAYASTHGMEFVVLRE